MSKVNQITKTAVTAFKEFTAKDPLRMAAATAFFATFSLPAIMLILIEVIGVFYNQDDLRKDIFKQLLEVFGKESSVKVYKISQQFASLAHNRIAGVAGFIFLVFVVTTLFNVVRNSINELWSIEADKNAGIKFYIKLRLKSLLIICFAGVILIIQLIAAFLQLLLKEYLTEQWSIYNSWLYQSVSIIVFVVIVSGWFMLLFKYLANAHPDWRTAFTGGLFTGILFTIGKAILGLLLTFNNLSEIFGKTSAFVLILLFIFYCSFIFYYGATFTKGWLVEKNRNMQLDAHAHVFTTQKVKS